MVKKILCVITLLALFACTLTSCLHKHEFGEWEITEEATCINAGSRTRYCNCGGSQRELISQKEHKSEEGICPECKKIFDPYKALLYIVKTEGEKSESSNTYTFPKTDYIGNGAKTFLSYNADSDKLSVMSATEEIILNIDIDPTKNKQDVTMIVQLDSDTYYFMGYIYADTFDMQNSTAYKTSTNAPSYLSSSMNDLATINVKITLDNLSKIIKLAHESFTVKTVGFEKFEN